MKKLQLILLLFIVSGCHAQTPTNTPYVLQPGPYVWQEDFEPGILSHVENSFVVTPVNTATPTVAPGDPTNTPHPTNTPTATPTCCAGGITGYVKTDGTTPMTADWSTNSILTATSLESESDVLLNRFGPNGVSRVYFYHGGPSVKYFGWDGVSTFQINDDLDVNGTMTATTVSGANVTSGSDPGHTHTDTSIADSLSITDMPNLTTNGFIKTGSGNGTLSIDTSTYLTGNETITLSGDVTGSGTTAITCTVVDNSHNHTDSTVSDSLSITDMPNLTTNGFVKTSGGVGNLSISTTVDISDDTNLTASSGVSLTGDNLTCTAKYSTISGNDGVTDVTATELETLTDTSNADSLHVHTVSGISDIGTYYVPYTGSNANITLGAYDLNADSGTLFVDASANRVHVNGTSPSYSLDVSGTFRATSTAYHNGVSIFSSYLDLNSYLDLDYSGSNYAANIYNTGNTSGYDGLYVNTANATSGTNVARFDAAGSALFTVRADGDIFGDTDTFYLDASADRVGIGTSSPATTLHVQSSSTEMFDLDSSSTTGSILMYFKQSGTARAYFYYIDSGDVFRIANGYGPINFRTGTAGSSSRITLQSNGDFDPDGEKLYDCGDDTHCWDDIFADDFRNTSDGVPCKSSECLDSILKFKTYEKKMKNGKTKPNIDHDSMLGWVRGYKKKYNKDGSWSGEYTDELNDSYSINKQQQVLILAVQEQQKIIDRQQKELDTNRKSFLILNKKFNELEKRIKKLECCK